MEGKLRLKNYLSLFQAIFIAEILCIATYLMIVQVYRIDFSLLLIQSIIIFLALFMSRISVGPGLEAAGVFILLFMGIIPILEEFNGIIYWGGSISLDEKVSGSLWLIFSALLMSIGYYLPFKNVNFYRFKEIVYSKCDCLRIFIYILLLSYFPLKANNFNIYNFLLKGGELTSDLLVNSKSEFLMIDFFIRPLIFNLGLAILFFSQVHWLKKFFLLLIAIFFAFPTGIYRFLVGILYIPFIYIIFLKKKNTINFKYKKYFISSFLIFSLIFIFPILEIFRNFTFEKYDDFTIGIEYLMTGHYDAYQMFLHALQTDSPTFGYGFLGVILFFYPRSIWDSKPINSGMEVAELTNLSFTNVSMPIFGEFYLNFSYVGILFGSLFLGIIFKVFDKNFRSDLRLNIRSLLYMQVSGSIVILMRGGLLSEFAYVVSIIITWLVIYADSRIFK
ncbi:MAG: O-antigen polymerase [Polynucleobacter sp.]